MTTINNFLILNLNNSQSYLRSLQLIKLQIFHQLLVFVNLVSEIESCP